MNQKSNDESQKKKGFDKVIVVLIVLSILLIGISFLAPIIFTNSASNQRYNFRDTGAIGETIGGLMNPFIALAGVFITFLAFYIQLKANKIQIDIFNENQKEQTNLLKEQLFFRLFDNLNQRIINFSYSEKTHVGNSDYSGYKSLDNLINIFLKNIDYECIALGRQLLAKQPEKIDLLYYIKILQATTLNDLSSHDDAEKLKKSIIDKNDFHERWEYIKLFVGGTDNKDVKVNSVLKSIGHVNFYKIDFSERENIYINVYDEIYKEFGGFMDGYTKNLSYLVDFIIKNHGNIFFIDFLKNNLSTQEFILIFYFCASRKSNQKIRNQIKVTNLLDQIVQTRDKFIDLPSVTELKREIEFVLNRFDASFG